MAHLPAVLETCWALYLKGLRSEAQHVGKARGSAGPDCCGVQTVVSQLLFAGSSSHTCTLLHCFPHHPNAGTEQHRMREAGVVGSGEPMMGTHGGTHTGSKWHWLDGLVS